VDEESHSGFLPPEPPGPEPELGKDAPKPQPPQAQPPPPPQPSPWQPQQAGWQPQQAGWQQPPPPQQQWQPPPPGWYPPPAGQPPQPWGWGPPQPAEPDNGPAVAGFVLSLVGAGLLLFSFGFSSIVSIGCSAFGIYYSRKGKRRVDAGETRKHRGLAQAGFVIGIVGLALAAIATAFYVLLLVLYVTDEGFRDDFDDEFDDSDSISVALRVLPAALRLLALAAG
jgi:hypothetical protein